MIHKQSPLGKSFVNLWVYYQAKQNPLILENLSYLEEEGRKTCLKLGAKVINQHLFNYENR